LRNAVNAAHFRFCFELTTAISMTHAWLPDSALTPECYRAKHILLRGMLAVIANIRRRDEVAFLRESDHVDDVSLALRIYYVARTQIHRIGELQDDDICEGPNFSSVLPDIARESGWLQK
jgi:hypothetical protein